MKKIKIHKLLIFICTIIFLNNCGYQPILNKDNQKFSISKFNLEGNKRLGGLLKNNLITVKKNENLLFLNVISEKKSSIADKSETGKVLTYTVTLNFKITVSDTKNNNSLFSKVYTKSKNYSASDIHVNTLNNEKKVIENLIESIANEIQIELNSIF